MLFWPLGDPSFAVQEFQVQTSRKSLEDLKLLSYVLQSSLLGPVRAAHKDSLSTLTYFLVALLQAALHTSPRIRCVIFCELLVKIFEYE